MTGILIDPVPNMYPNCSCGSGCEFPCWQRYGIDDDFSPADPHGCCCCRPVRSQPALPASNRSMLEEPKLTLERWVQERRREA